MIEQHYTALILIKMLEILRDIYENGTKLCVKILKTEHDKRSKLSSNSSLALANQTSKNFHLYTQAMNFKVKVWPTLRMRYS